MFLQGLEILVLVSLVMIHGINSQAAGNCSVKMEHENKYRDFNEMDLINFTCIATDNDNINLPFEMSQSYGLLLYETMSYNETFFKALTEFGIGGVPYKNRYTVLTYGMAPLDKKSVACQCDSVVSFTYMNVKCCSFDCTEDNTLGDFRNITTSVTVDQGDPSTTKNFVISDVQNPPVLADNSLSFNSDSVYHIAIAVEASVNFTGNITLWGWHCLNTTCELYENIIGFCELDKKPVISSADKKLFVFDFTYDCNLKCSNGSNAYGYMYGVYIVQQDCKYLLADITISINPPVQTAGVGCTRSPLIFIFFAKFLVDLLLCSTTKD